MLLNYPPIPVNHTPSPLETHTNKQHKIRHTAVHSLPRPNTHSPQLVSLRCDTFKLFTRALILLLTLLELALRPLQLYLERLSLTPSFPQLL